MKKLLLVDGMNLHFQMFFGMPRKIRNNSGVGIWGVIGFVGALNKIIDMTSPTHVAVIFDSEGDNPRRSVSEEYKANRPDYSVLSDDENPFSQLLLVYNALECMQIPHFEANGCECDDLIAAYALTMPRDTEIVISSFDSDYFQLISDRTSVLRYRGDASILCDRRYVREKCGVDPEYYADWKCLVGDTSDNVKGISGIGPKTASALISTYGSLENIIAFAASIIPSSLVEKLRDGELQLRRNYSLIKLDGTAKMPYELSQLEYNAKRMKTMDVMRSISLLP